MIPHRLPPPLGPAGGRPLLNSSPPPLDSSPPPAAAAARVHGRQTAEAAQRRSVNRGWGWGWGWGCFSPIAVCGVAVSRPSGAEHRAEGSRYALHCFSCYPPVLHCSLIREQCVHRLDPPMWRACCRDFKWHSDFPFSYFQDLRWNREREIDSGVLLVGLKKALILLCRCKDRFGPLGKFLVF